MKWVVKLIVGTILMIGCCTSSSDAYAVVPDDTLLAIAKQKQIQEAWDSTFKEFDVWLLTYGKPEADPTSPASRSTTKKVTWCGIGLSQ